MITITEKTKAHKDIDRIFKSILPKYGMTGRKEQIKLAHTMLDAMFEDSIALSDAGVMLGRLSGDGMYFDADGTVSRGEFTAMAMKVAGVIPSLGVFDTCFDDNEEIPASVRPYIATAQKMGVVRGSFNGDGLYFEADRAVTAAEASVIICNLMGVTADESAAVLASGGDIPVWARAEVGTLHAMGALDPPTSNAPLTRAEIAKLLYTFLEK